MNHRERVLAALDHRETDRVPLDMGSTIVTTLTRLAYQPLLEHLGLPPDETPNISHRQMDTVYPREDLLARYDIDCRAVYLKGPWEFETKELPGDRFSDEYGLVWEKASFYYDVVGRPFADLERAQPAGHGAVAEPLRPGPPGRCARGGSPALRGDRLPRGGGHHVPRSLRGRLLPARLRAVLHGPLLEPGHGARHPRQGHRDGHRALGPLPAERRRLRAGRGAG